MSIGHPTGRKTPHLNDVIVIGAGASVPYGFPTGTQLLDLLRKENLGYGDEVLLEILSDVEERKLFNYKSIPQFAEEQWAQSQERQLCIGWSRQLRGSVILSIDQFLKNLKRDRCWELGKRLMARQILSAEATACHAIEAKPNNETSYRSGSMHSIDWIQEFLSRVDLMSNWQKYLLKTTFLTFNYDRVLEFFLLRYLKVDKGCKHEEALDILKNMSILHMNGHLGDLEELPFGNLYPEYSSSPDFDPLFDPRSLTWKAVDWKQITSRMRTVWDTPKEESEHQVTQEKATSMIDKAQRIFAIGSSFIPENLEAIGLVKPHGTQPPNSQNLRATAMRLTKPQIRRTADSLGIRIGSDESHFFDMSARDFVVDHVVL